MKAKIEKAVPVRSGTELLVTLCMDSPVPRTHTYRVLSEAYKEVGSPAEGDILSEEELSFLVLSEEVRLAYARAVRILAAGNNTRASLVRKLTERGFLQDAAMQAVEKLILEGYIKENEMLLHQITIYAKRLWGPRKFMPALLQKGFSQKDIREALDEAERTGIYDADAIRKELLLQLKTQDASARRAWLYKHGF